MKKRTSKLLSLFLVLVMVLGMLPTTVFADFSEYGLCEECDEWLPLCEQCGYCMYCAFNAGQHCQGCSSCFTEVDVCDLSLEDFSGTGWCLDCCKDSNAHCDECEEHIPFYSDDLWCPYAGRGNHCMDCVESNGGAECNACNVLYCPICDNDMVLCSVCGFCEDCNAVDFGGEAYCKNCSDCLQCIGGHGHFCTNCHSCEDCSTVCQACGDCCSSCADVFCEGCNTCGECAAVCPECEEQCSECSADGLCGNCYTCGICAVLCPDCGDACNQCSTVCEACGTCDSCADLCDNCGEVCSSCAELCEDCDLCAACCAENSECSEGMCAKNSDYADHFCSICYQCFHEVEPCEYCLEYGEYYCADCCAEAAEKAGCDCGEGHICDLQEHMETVHLAEEVIVDIGHAEEDAPIPFTRWEYDVTHHWHACRACDPEDPFEGHITEKAEHSYGDDKKCTVCGCPDGSVIMIKQQPKNVIDVPIVPDSAWPSDELGTINNYVTFTVNAKSFNPNVVLSYQWYKVYIEDDGEEVNYLLEDFILDDRPDYDGTDKDEIYISGTKTNTLRIAPYDCVEKNTCFYYCEISDGNGNSMTTNRVQYITRHVFSTMTHEKEAPHNEVPLIDVTNDCWGSDTIIEVYFNGMGRTLYNQATTGYHYHECLADGCDEQDERTKEAHKMSEPIKHAGYTAKNSGKQIYYQECTECKWLVYYEEHEHDLEYYVYGITDETHVRECKTCDFSIIEPHTFGAWMPDEHGYPAMERNCPCGKEINAQETTEDGSTSYIDPEKIDEGGYVLLTPINGRIDKNAAKWGDTVQYTAEKNGKPCLGPTLLFAANSHNEILEYADESWGSFTPLLGESDTPLTWSLTLAEERPTDYPEQEDPQDIISLVIKFEYGDEVCNHKVYDEETGGYTDEDAAVLRGIKAAACNEDGYTGDWVCERCGVILEKGSVLPKSPKMHIYDPDYPCDEHMSWDYDIYRCEVCGTEFKIPHNRKFKIEVIGGSALDENDQLAITQSVKGNRIQLELDDTKIPEGKAFNKWVITKGIAGDFTPADSFRIRPDFLMPANDLIIEATYKDISSIDDACLYCHKTGAPKCTDCGERCGNCSELCQTCGSCEECAATCIICVSACSKCSEVCENCYKCLTCSGASGICDDCWKCGNCVALCPDCESHCSDCADICQTCGSCEECEFICEGCDKACTGCAEICNDCLQCLDCAGVTGICDDCERCGNCVTLCPNCESHCSDCAEFCQSCGWCEVCATICPNRKNKCSHCSDVCLTCGSCEECEFICEGCDSACTGCSDICSDCLQCLDCAGVTGFCDDCERCGNCVILCPNCESHCSDCAEFCQSCGKCIDCCEESRFEYTMLEGDGQTVARGNSAVFRSSAPFHIFGYVTVDNDDVDPSDYTAESGSTVITLSADFIRSLDTGEHEIWIVSNGGFAYGEFTVTRGGGSGGSGSGTNPGTGGTEKPAGTGKDPWSDPFVDVSERDWFYDDVRFAYENGLMNGTGRSTFSPSLATTRGMIVTILWRLEGKPAASGVCPFDDVKSGSYYEDAITWAAENGIVNGYGKGKFGPDDRITREQMAAILWRYAKYKGYDVSVGENTNILSYSDAFDISGYAYPALQWACGEGLINGYNGNLTPTASATRAQVAAILHRFIVKVVK